MAVEVEMATVNLKEVADPTGSRKEKGTGTAVSVDLKEFPELLDAIRLAAKDDDREVSNWLRRRLVKLGDDGVLFGK